MSHFYGSMQGGSGETTCQGTKTSGLYAHLRSWNIGVEVRLSHVDGKDIIEVWATAGSNDLEPNKLIATLVEGA